MQQNTLPIHTESSEIVLYQPNIEIRLEVRLAEESVWLTQNQIATLFDVKQPAISKHLNNIFKSGELEEESVYSILEYTATDGKTYKTKFYNLDAILSVGYRVNSYNATQFRKWANSVLKDYLLKGYSINQRFERLEQRVSQTEEKIDFFVRTSLPPVEGIFYEGQIFDAYKFVEDLIKDATREIILIDNYIDAHIFDLLEQRSQGVAATIYTEHVTPALLHTQQLCTTQHGRTIDLRTYSTRFHDRFLIIDDTVYHFGASFKDLGRRLFAFTRMEAAPAVILSQL